MRRSLIATTVLLAAALSACATSEDPAGGDKSASAAGPVSVTDARDKLITLDHPAKRIGATEWNVAEYAESLGVSPVAVSDVKGFKTWDGSVDLAKDVTDLGTRGEPSTDTVASAGLDVLFVTDELTGDAVKQIEKDTPVIVLPGGKDQDPVQAMWDNVDLVAKVTGTQSKAAALKKDFDEEVAETRADVQKTGFTAPVALSDAYAEGGQVSVRPYGEGSLMGGVMKAAGLKNAWSQVPGLKYDPVYGLSQTDVEGLTKLPATTAFWHIGNAEDGGSVFEKELAGNKIWTSLPFVKAKSVHRLPDKIWMFGGPASMTEFLDTIQDVVQK